MLKLPESEMFYLGTVVNCGTDVKMEIEARTEAVNECYFGLMKHHKSKL